MREMTVTECWDRLDSIGTGRIALSIGALPVILPVAFAVSEHMIVFPAILRTRLAAATSGQVVAFQADAYALDATSGWSVRTVGTAQVVDAGDYRDTMTRLSQGRWSPPSVGFGARRLEVTRLVGDTSSDPVRARPPGYGAGAHNLRPPSDPMSNILLAPGIEVVREALAFDESAIEERSKQASTFDSVMLVGGIAALQLWTLSDASTRQAIRLAATEAINRWPSDNAANRQAEESLLALVDDDTSMFVRFKSSWVDPPIAAVARVASLLVELLVLATSSSIDRVLEVLLDLDELSDDPDHN